MTRQIVGQPLPPELSDRLKKCGFDPGIPVYDFNPLDFSLDQLKRALFASTYRQPITVTFRPERDKWQGTLVSEGVEMLVELVQAIYVPYEPFVGSGLMGCYNEPEWYVRGFLYKRSADPHPAVIRVHAYLEVDGPSDAGQIDRTYVQVVHHQSGADLSTPLVSARHVGD